jgi:hypothetical protein
MSTGMTQNAVFALSTDPRKKIKKIFKQFYHEASHLYGYMGTYQGELFDIYTLTHALTRVV